MLPAFRSNGEALSFGAVVAGFLALPFLLKAVGPSSREEVWKGISHEWGPTEYAAWATFKESYDPDILFVGPSRTASAIVPDKIALDLSLKMRRPVSVRVLALAWATIDVDYLLLRDYLARHRPKLVVVEAPLSGGELELYHDMYDWERFGELSAELDGLAAFDSLKLYGDNVIAAPRQFLTLMRSNLLNAKAMPNFEDADFIKNLRFAAWGGKVFKPQSLQSPSLHSQTLPSRTQETPRVASARVFRLAALVSSQSNSAPQSDTWLPTPYAERFLRLTAGLFHPSGPKLVWLHTPSADEYDRNSVSVTARFAQDVGGEAKMIAISSKELYSGMDERQMERYYSSPGHLNQDGALRFSASILSALSLEIPRSAIGPGAPDGVIDRRKSPANGGGS